MPEIEQPVAPMEVDYRCDACGEGRMRPTGHVLTSYPPKYPHRCAVCGHQQVFDRTYPYVRHEQVPTQEGDATPNSRSA